MRFVLILVAASLANATCLSVPSAKILARDLAAAVPLFEQIPPETELGFSPMPGTQRLLRGTDLLGIAKQYGLSVPEGAPVRGVCFERATRALSVKEIRPVLLSALGVNAQLEITEVSAQQVPPGRLEFRREGLGRPRTDDPSMPVIWRGRLVYDGQHSLAIWAKVRVTVDREIIVAAEEIPGGSLIEANQLKMTSARRFPLPVPVGTLAIEQIAGKMNRKRFAVGDEIVALALVDAMDVKSGETVRVRVTDGGAALTLEGIAQGSGKKGQAIVIHNPSSGKNFRALIDGTKQVVVHSAPGAIL
jgi:flagella basal body P-ring formation protein FlgA